MRADARSKKLLDAIEGTVDEPTTGHSSKVWKAWKAQRDAAASLIIKGLDNSQIVHVRGLEDDPEAMWEKLRMVHEPVGLSGAIGMWMELYALTYDGALPMKTFLGRVTGIAERLQRFYQVEVSDEQKIARMISSLPAEYSGLIRTLDNTDPSLITLDYVQKKILVEDNTVRAEKAKRGENSATSNSEYGSSALAANSDVTCENCGGGGHTKERCWHKGGDREGQYPDWWKGKRNPSLAIPKTHMAYAETVIL
jgi:hypothetical protein